MKKNKAVSFAIAALTSVTLIYGGSQAYAWFTDVQQNATAAVVNTGNVKLSTIPQPVVPATTKLVPGEKVKLTSTNNAISLAGNRSAIVRVSLTDVVDPDKSWVEVNLKQDITAEDRTRLGSKVDEDYDPTGKKMTKQRIDEVVSLELSGTGANATEFVKIGNDYYAYLKADGTTAEKSKKLGEMFLVVDKELGGMAKDPTDPNAPLSLTRPFEQLAEFKMQYQLAAVQNTPEAIKDIYGTEVFDEINAKYATWFTQDAQAQTGAERNK